MGNIFQKHPWTLVAVIAIVAVMIVALVLIGPAVNPASADRVYLLVLSILAPAFVALLSLFKQEQTAAKVDEVQNKTQEIAEQTDGRLSAVEKITGIGPTNDDI